MPRDPLTVADARRLLTGRSNETEWTIEIKPPVSAHPRWAEMSKEERTLRAITHHEAEVLNQDGEGTVAQVICADDAHLLAAAPDLARLAIAESERANRAEESSASAYHDLAACAAVLDGDPDAMCEEGEVSVRVRQALLDRDEALAERARIVAWLRDEADSADPESCAWSPYRAADAIERGEHNGPDRGEE